MNILTLNANCFFGIEASKEKDSAVDHLSLGIQNFKVEDAAAKLEKRGLKVSRVSKEGLKFTDPDGLLVQLNAPGCSRLLAGAWAATTLKAAWKGGCRQDCPPHITAVGRNAAEFGQALELRGRAPGQQSHR